MASFSKRRAYEIVQHHAGNIMPGLSLGIGSVATVITAPPENPAKLLVQIGGALLTCTASGLVTNKYTKQNTWAHANSNAFSGATGLLANAVLTFNGLHAMYTAYASHDVTGVGFGLSLAVANGVFFARGNAAVLVDAVREMRRINGETESFPQTNWNGVSWNYAAGSFGIVIAGALALPKMPQVGFQLIGIGLSFMASPVSNMVMASPVSNMVSNVGWRETLASLRTAPDDMAAATTQARQVFRLLRREPASVTP